jgi:hypothetical protein
MRLENEGGWVKSGGNMLMYAGLDGPCYSYGVKEHLVMASSSKFSEKFSLQSLTQQHKLPREKVSYFFVIIAFSSNNFVNKNK